MNTNDQAPECCPFCGGTDGIERRIYRETTIDRLTRERDLTLAALERFDVRVKLLKAAGDRLRKYLRIAVGPDATGWETPHGVDIGKRIEAAIADWTKAKEIK